MNRVTPTRRRGVWGEQDELGHRAGGTRTGTRRRRQLASGASLVAVLATAAACGDPAGIEVALDEFRQIPDAAALDLGAVTPGIPADYWEFRLTFGGYPDSVLGAGGPLARDALTATAQATLDTLQSGVGFGLLCPPGDCTRYLVSVRGDTVFSWNDAEGVRAFLGGVNAEVEAILLTAAHGYTWSESRDTGGIRTVGGDFELLVERLVEFCDPVQVNRYLIRVSAAGTLTVVQEEVYRQEPGLCI